MPSNAPVRMIRFIDNKNKHPLCDFVSSCSMFSFFFFYTFLNAYLE